MMRAALLAFALVLAACADAPETPRDLERAAAQAENSQIRDNTAQQDTERDTCGASQFQSLMGQPAAAIDRASLPPHTRIITPGMMVTQDFAPGRLNVQVGPDGKVASLRCY